jgi:hypothetical protein
MILKKDRKNRSRVRNSFGKNKKRLHQRNPNK